MIPRASLHATNDADEDSLQQTGPDQSMKRYRTNDEWIADLTGQNGGQAQQLAHIDLSNYLYVVVFNYLHDRHTQLASISAYCEDELITIAQDFVQNFMEKMVKNNHELLRKYSNTGRFTSWAAQVIINLCATEFRRARWSRQQRMNQQPYWDRCTAAPESTAVRSQIAETIHSCLGNLPQNYREALVRCIGEGERASAVAQDLDVSPNAVYILIHRAKSAMRKQLTQQGIGPSTLSAYKD